MSANLFMTLRRPIYGQSQLVAYTGTAGTIANGLPAGTASVAVLCTTAAYVKVGVSPTATTADFSVPANTLVLLPVEMESITGGSGLIKVSAVQVAAGGNLTVMPLAD